jgi:putative Mn2+ efflux pump MntP
MSRRTAGAVLMIMDGYLWIILRRYKTMSEVAQIISSLGFPIVAAVGCAMFVKFIYTENQKQLTEINKEHKDEVAKMTEALNNNTLALQRLIDKLDKE